MDLKDKAESKKKKKENQFWTLLRISNDTKICAIERNNFARCLGWA